MAESNPSILSAAIPTEAQPNNRFTFDVTVKQGGPDPWASEDWCTQSDLDIRGWKTPVALAVDGEEADRSELCLSSGDTGTARLSAALPAGQHELEVIVYQTGGNAYDFEEQPSTPNDTVRQTVTVDREASDPSRPTTGDKVTQFLERLADALGGTTQQVAFGMALAVVLLVIL